MPLIMCRFCRFSVKSLQSVCLLNAGLGKSRSNLIFKICNNLIFRILQLPGDFKSWESPQTLRALFIGLFEHVERFRNLKFAVIRITDIHSTVLSSSEGTAAIHLAFK